MSHRLTPRSPPPRPARGPGRRPAGKPPRRRAVRRLEVEWLEDRTLLNGHTLATATPVTFGPGSAATLPGFLDAGHWVDLFRLDLAAGDIVTADVQAQRLGSGLNPALRAFDD